MFVIVSFSTCAESSIKLRADSGSTSYQFYFKNNGNGDLSIGVSPAHNISPNANAWLIFNHKKIEIGVSKIKKDTAWLYPLPKQYADAIKGTAIFQVNVQDGYQDTIKGEFFNKKLDQIIAVVEDRLKKPKLTKQKAKNRVPLNVATMSGNEILAKIEFAKDYLADCKIKIKVYAGGSSDYKATHCALRSVDYYNDFYDIMKYFNDGDVKLLKEKLTVKQAQQFSRHIDKIALDFNYIKLWLDKELLIK